MTERAILVIGIGNPDRGDDAAGRHVAARLSARGLAGVVVREATGTATELMDLWHGFDTVILIDASAPQGTPGKVRILDANKGALPPLGPEWSSHGLGLGEAIELARALGDLPAAALIVALEGKNFSHGAGLSPEIAASLDEAEQVALAEIDRLARLNAASKQ